MANIYRSAAELIGNTPLWELAKRPENAGKTIVVLLPDSGQRYLTTAMYE